MEKLSAGTGIGSYRRGDVLTDLALVTPGQLVAYESKRFKSVNLCKITETFKDKLYAIFVNPDNPAEKSKTSDEEFVVYPTDLKQGEYYIVLEPSPEQVGEPSKKAKEPKNVMPVAPENPTVSEETGTPMPTPEGAPAVEEAPVTGSKKTASTFLDDEEDIAWLFDTALKNYQSYRESTKVALLAGNEDSPTSVELFFNESPNYDQAPDKVFVQNEEGNLVEHADDVTGTKKTAEADAEEGYWQVYSYDIMGGEVNNVYKTDVRVYLPKDTTSSAIVDDLVSQDWLTEKGGKLAKNADYVMTQDEFQFDNKKTGVPMFEVRWVEGTTASKKTSNRQMWKVYVTDAGTERTLTSFDLWGDEADEEQVYEQARAKVAEIEKDFPNADVTWKMEKAGSKKTAIESPVKKQKDYGEEPFSAQERIDRVQSKLNGLEKKAEAPSWVPVVEMDNLMDYFQYSNALADAGIACSYEEKGGKHYVRIADDVLADATSKQKITEIIVTTGIGKNLLSEPAKKQESLEKKANDPYVVKEPNFALEEKLPFANLLEPRDVVEASDEDDESEEEPELELDYEFVYPKDTQESNELGEEYFDDPEAITINEDELTAYYAGKRIARITSEQYGSQGLDALAGPLYKWMEREQYWPSVILQGERGNQTVLSINKKGALDNFEMRPIQDEEYVDSLGSHDTFAMHMFANTEAEGGSDTDGDDGSAYSLLDGRNFSGVNEENAEGVVAEYLDGKAMSLASFDDFSGFVEDIYGIPKELTAEYEDAWVDEDQRKLVACIMDNAVRNVIG